MMTGARMHEAKRAFCWACLVLLCVLLPCQPGVGLYNATLLLMYCYYRYEGRCIDLLTSFDRGYIHHRDDVTW